MKYLTSGRILFSTLFVVLFAILIVTAIGYNPKARTFPLIVAVPVFIGTLANWVVDLRAVQRGEKPKKEKSTPNLPVAVAEATASEPVKKKEKLSDAEKRKRELFGIAWLIGFVVSIALLGFPIATIGYLVLFIRFYNHESWKLTIVYTVILWAFIWIAFVFFLKSTLYPGLIFELLGL
jgi:hypothetical protein